MSAADRELLELAAKAAGIGGVYADECGDVGIHNGHRLTAWNPLTDDGEAMRLAVKLCIDIEHNPPADKNAYVIASRRGCEMMFAPVSIVEDVDGYRDAATRRAIVRAAAEIGEHMEGV